jgi:hypothetical protein
MNHRHFLVRLFADSNTVEEVESRDQQIAAVQEETGRGMLLALGGFSTDGTSWSWSPRSSPPPKRAPSCLPPR